MLSCFLPVLRSKHPPAFTMNNCCDSMLKYLIFIFNFFLFMSGVALIAMGTYIQIEMSDYLNFLDDSYLNR